jgi:hypothetical protein
MLLRNRIVRGGGVKHVRHMGLHQGRHRLPIENKRVALVCYAMLLAGQPAAGG